MDIWRWWNDPQPAGHMAREGLWELALVHIGVIRVGLSLLLSLYTTTNPEWASAIIHQVGSTSCDILAHKESFLPCLKTLDLSSKSIDACGHMILIRAFPSATELPVVNLDSLLWSLRSINCWCHKDVWAEHIYGTVCRHCRGNGCCSLQPSFTGTSHNMGINFLSSEVGNVQFISCYQKYTASTGPQGQSNWLCVQSCSKKLLCASTTLRVLWLSRNISKTEEAPVWPRQWVWTRMWRGWTLTTTHWEKSASCSWCTVSITTPLWLMETILLPKQWSEFV